MGKDFAQKKQILIGIDVRSSKSKKGKKKRNSANLYLSSPVQANQMHGLSNQGPAYSISLGCQI